MGGTCSSQGEIEAVYGVMLLKLERWNCMEYVGVYGFIH